MSLRFCADFAFSLSLAALLFGQSVVASAAEKNDLAYRLACQLTKETNSARCSYDRLIPRGFVSQQFYIRLANIHSEANQLKQTLAYSHYPSHQVPFVQRIRREAAVARQQVAQTFPVHCPISRQLLQTLYNELTCIDRTLGSIESALHHSR